jgi:rubrerythrin
MAVRPGREKLVALLKLAYSGEKAAALAYRGHWKSVRAPHERETIYRIEWEEWTHRREVGRMLAGLGESPSPLREFAMGLIGGTLGPLCFVSGRFLPMYFAWRLEVRNVWEYETAARFASESSLGHLVPCLMRMAEVEQAHERFFREAAGLAPVEAVAADLLS